MRKKIIIIIILALIITIGFVFRYELLFTYQYSRLKALACQEKRADFINDSCLNKIWVHRVNSVERYKKLAGKFAGTETDITWDSITGTFLVYHPPLEDTAITFDRFLHAIHTGRELMWLDTRATMPADTLVILTELNRLDKLANIRMNAVLELYDTTVANFLAEKGYWVALNINTEWIHQFSRESQWEQLKNSMSPKIGFVSQEDIHVPLLKKYFPNKDIITWSVAFKNYFNRQHLKDLVNDDQVKIILVNIKSAYYR